MPRTVSGGRTTQSSSNPNPSGIPQGTPGGRSMGRRGGMVPIGDEMYLWILVVMEALAIGALRQQFRRYHGG